MRRVGSPGCADDESREKDEEKEEGDGVGFEEVFNSFRLEKTDDEVEEDDDESSADTGLGLGKEDGDEEKKSGDGVYVRKVFFSGGVAKKER